MLTTYSQHTFVSTMLDWVHVLGDLTPKTWVNWANLPDGKSFVVKGRTNSRKQQWNTHMFAPTRDDVPKIAKRLIDDSLLMDQGLVVREYVPLVSFEQGINGLPITNEWRCFFLGNQMIAKGYYWTHSDVGLKGGKWTAEAEKIAQTAANRLADHISFFVVDVAETTSGNWIVVEVNDGQMSGLNSIPAEEFYSNLRDQLQVLV